MGLQRADWEFAAEAASIAQARTLIAQRCSNCRPSPWRLSACLP